MNRMQSLTNLINMQDPSLSLHIQTIHNVENRSLPKLKYSLTCIANTLAYSNSNRQYNVVAISKPRNFQQIIHLLIDYQDQKILEECLSILNVLLNEGNDLTTQQQSQIMHSLSYVNVNTEAQKGFISDKLAQEILLVTYKLKTKKQLSQFIATLMSEKMTSAQAKKFIKQLKKQQIKNIPIADLIKIGMKFKTNVLLMNEILNLIYEKVFSRRDQSDIKKLFQFLPKIVQQSIDDETISYKCLQIYKIIQCSDYQIDPLIGRYLQSLLKYKKDLLLPLKRQFVVNQQDFLRILNYGTQFQIYHLLLIDYLVRNGYTKGKENWRQALKESNTKKNLKLKQICLRLGDTDSQPCLSEIKQTQQAQFIDLLPIQALYHPSSLLQKLLSQPSISNCLYVTKNLCNYKRCQELLLKTHKISLKQKEFHVAQQLQKVVKQSFTQQFVYQQLKNITKVKHKIILKGQLYFIWLPILLKDQKLLRDLENQLIQIMNYESIEIQEKFYVVGFLLENKMEKVVAKFLLYLNRQLEAISGVQESQRKTADNLFTEIKYYLGKWVTRIKDDTQLITLYQNKLVFHLERTSQLLFSKLVEFKSQAVTEMLSQLQKWDFYGQTWRQPYRWILTALQEISQQNPLFTLNCLQLFEMSIQNIRSNQIPAFVKERFMRSLKKNWSKLQSQHLFTVERIIQILWQNHQYPILEELLPIKLVSQLIQEQKQFNKKNQFFFQNQHPTSNFMINLQMSHFFGVISQQQFVRHILHLYDKRFAEVKRFTQKNVLSLMNFIIWVYQYSEQDMDKGLSQMILAFLSYRAEGANDISSYNIRKKCIQIVAVVGHSINLLKLPIKQLLQTYIGEAVVIKNLNQILQVIIQSKPSFVSQLNLEKIIQSVMICLITCQDINLIEEYINFIEQICYIENSKYSIMFENSTETLYQVLKIQHNIIQKYRQNLVMFVLDILKHYQFRLQNSLLWFLMNKYFVEQSIQLCLLQSLMRNTQGCKQKTKLQYSNQKFLVRLIMHHNENQEIIGLVQQIMNSFQKQSPGVRREMDQGHTRSTVTSVIQAAQDKFLRCFKSQEYGICQQLVPEIRNPFLCIKKTQLRAFLACKDLDRLQNLLNFLVKNPTTRNQILGVQEFYIKIQCLPYILELNQSFTWSTQNLQKIKFKSFIEHKQVFELQLYALEAVIRSTVGGLFLATDINASVLCLLRCLKTCKHQIQLLSFYSKFIQQQSNGVLFQIVNCLNLPQDIELMKLDLAYKISDPSQASCQLLLHHLFVHIQNIFFTESPQMQNQQRYIKDIAQLIRPQQMQKNLPIVNEFFICLSSRLKRMLASKTIYKEILQVCNCYLEIYEANSGTTAKSVEIKLVDCFGIVSALLFMHRNGSNVNVGVAGKIIALLENKVSQNQTLKQAYDYLITNKTHLQQQQQALQNTRVNTPKGDNKITTGNKPVSPCVVFAKQLDKEEQLSSLEQQEYITQAFQKSKQLEEYMSVVPRKIKELAQKSEKQKQQVRRNASQQLYQSKDQLSVQQQNIIRPKQSSFDEKSFYQVRAGQGGVKKTASSEQRLSNLQSIKCKQNQQISITSLKQHSKFISSLSDYNQLTREQIQQLIKSIDNITITVNQHHYYVKKLMELQVTLKLINIYKGKGRLFPLQLASFAEVFENKLLGLHYAMSCKKEKRTIVFDDQLTIEFFKLILQKSLAIQRPSHENIVVIEIVVYCIKSIDAFFKQGLISMLIQLVKLDINVEDVLSILCKVQLTKHIIYEIYHRGLLNKLVEVFSSKKKLSGQTFNLWIKLAGKICSTPGIQQKYLQKNIHRLIWQRHQESLSKDLQSNKNMAFFFAYLCKKNQKVFQFISENQILQKLLSSLQNESSEQLYMLFYNIVIQNQTALEYCFRIKYHLHLIQKLSRAGQKPKARFFYKSLGQTMAHKHHQPVFFKEKAILKLVKEYNIKPEPSIYECLLDFIVTLDSDKEFQQLKKQEFWECLSLFQYKLGSEATYAYILQIFLVMIKKGRIKQFNTALVRGKVTLKAQYSINLEGKQLALRFITALSIRNKQCYITQRCMLLLASVVGFKVTYNQLDLIQDMLEVEGMLKNFEFFSFCYDFQITHMICNRFKGFTPSELLSALKILNILGTQAKNIKILRDKLLMPAMQMLRGDNPPQRAISKQVEEWLFKLILIIVSFRQNHQIVQKMQLGTFMLQILQKIMKRDQKDRKKILEDYVTVVEMSRQNNMIPLVQLERILERLGKSKAQKEVTRISEIKQNIQGLVSAHMMQAFSRMAHGTSVRMYKNDGSNSELILHLTEDQLQLNCVTQKGQPVKQKWRLVLSQINQINTFSNEKQYQKSAFYRASGVFTSAPDKRLCLTAKSKSNQFNMLFNKKQQKDEWKKHIELAIQNCKKLLNQFK